MVVIWGLLGLCVIVVVHEFGHFLAAKALGIGVEAFSVGMGPVLLHKTVKGTDFRLSLLPVGGYCSMKGEDAFQKAFDAKLDEIPKEPGSFYENPLRRMATAFAGPFANVLFALAAFTAIAFVGYSYPSSEARVIIATEIYPEMTSAAAEAGIKSGDYILAIGKDEIRTFSDVYTTVATHPDETLDFKVLRGGETLTLPVHIAMEKESASGKIGVMNWITPQIETVAAGSAAEKAGLQSGDIIKACNGIETPHTAALARALEQAEGAGAAFVALQIGRGGRTLEVELPLEKTEDGGSYNLGVGFKTLIVEERASSFFDGIARGFKETGGMIALTLKTITWFFKGIDVTKAVSGPIRITVMLGEAAESGFSAGFREGLVTVLNFLSLISISLFIMNLLPIPILDGGLILFALVECIRGKGLSPKVLYRVQIAGLALIAVLFLVGFTGDIQYIIERVRALFAR